MQSSTIVNENFDSIESNYWYCHEKIESILSSVQNTDEFSSSEFNEISQEIQFYQELNNEFNLVKKELDELNSEKLIQKENYLSHAVTVLAEENKSITKEIIKNQEETAEVDKISNRCHLFQQVQKKHNEENKSKQLLHLNMEASSNELKLLNKININLNIMLNNIVRTSKEENNLVDDILLKKYSTIEILSGIKVTDCVAENSRSWYNLIFSNLPDECLEFEKNSNLAQLTPDMVDQYKAMFERRKSNPSNVANDNSNKVNKCVTVNNINDYKVIAKNYINLYCSILTKQEIIQSMKKYLIAWVDGSQVLTYNIDGQSSKQASIVLPIYYPLCGTSYIKLTSLKGYNNLEADDPRIKNFNIRDNLNSLSEWIEHLTEMFHNKAI